MVYQKELIQIVAEEANYNEAVVTRVIEAFFKELQQQLVHEEQVLLRGIDTFYTRWQAEGRVRHIQTGKEIKVPERRVVGFRVADALKQAVRRS